MWGLMFDISSQIMFVGLTSSREKLHGDIRSSCVVTFESCVTNRNRMQTVMDEAINMRTFSCRHVVACIIPEKY